MRRPFFVRESFAQPMSQIAPHVLIAARALLTKHSTSIHTEIGSNPAQSAPYLKAQPPHVLFAAQAQLQHVFAR